MHRYIMEGDFIVEYTGEIIDDVACEQRLWEDKKRGEDNFYLMEISPSQVIDARHKARPRGENEKRKGKTKHLVIWGQGRKQAGGRSVGPW